MTAGSKIEKKNWMHMWVACMVYGCHGKDARVLF